MDAGRPTTSLSAGLRCRCPQCGEGRLFRSEDGVGQGWYGGAGIGLEIPAGRLVVVPTLRGRAGTVVALEDARSRILGGEVGLTLRLPIP